MAPTYIANLVSFVALALTALHIQVAPESLQITVTTLLVIFVPLFTMFRQWYTNRSTLIGSRP